MRPKPFTGEWFKAYTELEPGKGCVLYTGFADPLGYCRVYWKGKGGVLMHRVAYEVAFGPFDPGMKVCHRCDVPNCINPEHLYLGTQKDNLREMFAKGRARPRGKATAPLTSFPAVSYRVLARERQPPARKNSNGGAQVVDRVHLTGPLDGLKERGAGAEPHAASVATSERWKQVTGVPSVRPTQAVQLWRRPFLETEIAERIAANIKTGLMVSPYCGSRSESRLAGLTARSNEPQPREGGFGLCTSLGVDEGAEPSLPVDLGRCGSRSKRSYP